MLDTEAISSQRLSTFYGVKSSNFLRSYKKHLSEFGEWVKEHSDDNNLVFPENISKSIGIDETSLSNGELYTIVTNKLADGKQGSLIALVEGVKSEDVIKVLKEIPKDQRDKVEEITLDMANNMNLIASRCFGKADIVIDRFHVQQLASEAVQEQRIKIRWETLEAENEKIKESREKGDKYVPELLPNGDTLPQLLARSRYALFKPTSKWTKSQKQRAELLFDRFPKIHKAYKLSMHLRSIFEEDITKYVANLKLARWYNDVEESGFKSFQTIMNTFTYFSDKITNYFNSRATNAYAESFNSRIKDFRREFRGVTDIKFFLFRISKVFG